MIQTDSPSAGGGSVNYFYDANGQRAVKEFSDGGATVYVYDAFGKLAAMYNNFAAPTPPCTTCYLTTDYLGSVRMVTDANANVVARHDYLPFGQEILAGQAGRGSQWGAASPVNEKFTGQIRDQETNLDYFDARYFSGAQGRFNSPDDPFADQDPSDPQSWNLYSYVRNNPLNAIDPSGNDCITTSDQSDTRVTMTVASGSCEGNKGVYIPGTVDTSSLTYNGSSIGYSYTPNDSNNLAGSGTVALGPSQGGSGSDWGPGSSNMIGAAQIGRTASIGNALGAGLVAFGSLVAPIPMAIAGYGADPSSCLGNAAIAVLPELGPLTKGANLARPMRGVHAAEIWEKAGGFVQAATDFESLQGAERTIGNLKVKDLSDGSKAILRNFSKEGRLQKYGTTNDNDYRYLSN